MAVTGRRGESMAFKPHAKKEFPDMMLDANLCYEMMQHAYYFNP